MEMKHSSSISTIILVLSGFASFVNSQSDSCSSQMSVSSLIPFNTSSLTCVSAWSSEGFILRYTKAGPSLWNFVLSAPDSRTYIGIGFSPTGMMVGSSAVAGWKTSGGAGIAKQYFLGGYSSSQCRPGQGSLPLVKGSPLLVSQSSLLYLAFQLNTAQPQTNLIFAVGPENTLPSSSGYLSTHRSMTTGTLNAPADGGGGSGGEESDEGNEHGGEVPNGRHVRGGGRRNGAGGYNTGTTEWGWGISSARKHALLTVITPFLVQWFFC